MNDRSAVVDLIQFLIFPAASQDCAYTDRLNDERLGDVTLEGLTSLLREFGDPAARVTPTERAWVAALLFKQVQKDNDLSGLVFEKFEAHPKLMRYEQRAFNQLRKKE